MSYHVVTSCNKQAASSNSNSLVNSNSLPPVVASPCQQLFSNPYSHCSMDLNLGHMDRCLPTRTSAAASCHLPHAAAASLVYLYERLTALRSKPLPALPQRQTHRWQFQCLHSRRWQLQCSHSPCLQLHRWQLQCFHSPIEMLWTY